MKRSLVLLSFLITCLPLIAGCGAEGPAGHVTGTVSYKGEPISNGTIVFEVPEARPATGKIVDGQIVDSTSEEPGIRVPVGTAKIAVFASEAPVESSNQEASGEQTPAVDPGGDVDMSAYMGMGAESLIPPHYNDPESSGLTFEFEEGENTISLDLTDEN